ncbi:MAG: DinB family protein [Terriglobia bacterium]
MHIRSALATGLLLLSSLPLHAADNAAVTRLLARWEKSKNYIVELANQMPADAYTSRPNPEEMTFGEQIVHIASGNMYITGSLQKPVNSLFDPKKTDKESAIAAVKASFDSGAAAIGSLSDADLNNRIVEAEGQKMTALECIILAFDHVEHHRGQCIVYLRVKGIKPVDYRF